MPLTATPTVHSFYRYNIEPAMLDAQKRVFEHFGVPLNQCRDDKAKHAGWIDALLADDAQGDIMVIADIDAFPLSHGAYAQLVAAAERGAIAGLAQTTNDKRPDKIFAAPMFLAMRRSVWRDFGAPSMFPYETGDVAQIMTDTAEARGVEVALTYPSFALRPIWALANRGVYGTATFYGDMEFFHLYQARHINTVDLFCAIADGAIAGRHDWGAYLEMLAAAPAEENRGRSLSQMIRKLRG